MHENGLKRIQGKNGKFHTYKGDNGLIKENLLLHSKKENMIEYINYYSNDRINKKRKGLSPLEYRQQYSILTKNIIE